VPAAPAATGSITGSVKDKASGAALGGVSVSVASEGAWATATTEGDGRYTVAKLPPGRYSVLFVFGTARVKRVVDVAAGKPATVDVSIDVAASGEVVEIREQPPASKAAIPRPLEKYGASPPPYSDEAILSDVWTRAWLLLDLDARGRVTRVTFLKRAGHDLDEIAVREAKKYRFTPARDDAGKAIPSQVIIPMEWPSYWRERTLVSTGKPPCAGSGPLNLGSVHPTYRDCSVPELPPGVPIIEPADPPVQFLPF
jgi:hypothetical protein